jgi:hypothetical protein
MTNRLNTSCFFTGQIHHCNIITVTIAKVKPPEAKEKIDKCASLLQSSYFTVVSCIHEMDNMSVGEVKISGSNVANGRKHNDGAV